MSSSFLRKKTTASIAAALAVASIGLAGCGGGQNAGSGAQGVKTTSAPAKPYHVRIGYSPALCNASIFTAYENGYFKDEGLEPEMIQVDPAHVSDAVGAGQIDVFQGLASKLIQPLSNGLPAQVTSGLHTGCVYLLVPKDSPVQTLADLKGKKIGVPGLADAGTIIARRALHAAGISVTDKDLEVEFPVFSRNDLPQALEKGAVDAIAVGDPVASIAVKEYGLRELINTATTPPFKDEYCCVSVVTDKLAKEHPEVAAKVTRAIQRGALWTAKHPTEAAQLELDKKYVAGNIELNSSLMRSYDFRPSVKGGYDALKACATELTQIGLLKEGTDGARFADEHFTFFKDLADRPKDDEVK